ncbi:hypothetical protein C8J56DRAFT_909941 [Mycena floridula]|nr:hypothetical protein C8J56DRAFT_909941 [Mycena floridula]
MLTTICVIIYFLGVFSLGIIVPLEQRGYRASQKHSDVSTHGRVEDGERHTGDRKKDGESDSRAIVLQILAASHQRTHLFPSARLCTHFWGFSPAPPSIADSSQPRFAFHGAHCLASSYRNLLFQLGFWGEYR